MTKTGSGKDAYRITFVISDGPHTDRRLSKQWYFTEAALPFTWRDLRRFGITSSAQLRQPFPTGRLLVDLAVGRWVDRNGVARHDVKWVEVVEPQVAGR